MGLNKPYPHPSKTTNKNLRNYIFVSNYQAHGLLLQKLLSSPWIIVTEVINQLFDTFPNTVHIMLNIEPQIENIYIVLHLNKTLQ